MFGRSITAVLTIALLINGGEAKQPIRRPYTHSSHHTRGSEPIDTSNYRFLTNKTKCLLYSHPCLSIATNQNAIFSQPMWWRAYQMFISNWERCTRALCPSVKIIPCFIYSSPRLENQATTSQFGWMVDRVAVQCRGFCRRMAALPGNPAPTNPSLMSIHGLI